MHLFNHSPIQLSSLTPLTCELSSTNKTTTFMTFPPFRRMLSSSLKDRQLTLRTGQKVLVVKSVSLNEK